MQAELSMCVNDLISTRSSVWRYNNVYVFVKKEAMNQLMFLDTLKTSYLDEPKVGWIKCKEGETLEDVNNRKLKLVMSEKCNVVEEGWRYIQVLVPKGTLAVTLKDGSTIYLAACEGMCKSCVLQHIYTFEYGREYQLVMDKSRLVVPRTQGRLNKIKEVLKTMTDEEIKQEAWHTAKSFKKSPRRSYNESLDLSLTLPEGYDCQKYNCMYYLGRCVQYLLDSNNKLSWEDVLKMDDIVSEAEQLKALNMRIGDDPCRSYSFRHHLDSEYRDEGHEL